jgi:hypothetical protein
MCFLPPPFRPLQLSKDFIESQTRFLTLDVYMYKEHIAQFLILRVIILLFNFM